MKLTYVKRLAFVLAAGLLVLCASAITLIRANSAYAYPTEQAETENEGTEIEPRGTSLSLSINCGDGKVWATAKNEFTLFYSTVVVVVQLYSSETYAESYTEMHLTSQNSIADLDMGKTLTTETSTKGVEKFWIARMRYQINGGDWKAKETGPYRISASGEFLGYT